MIEYCLIFFLNCETHACIDELNKRQRAYVMSIKKAEKLQKAFFLTNESPVTIISINGQPFKTKNSCDANFYEKTESKSSLTYNHICYPVNLQYKKDCFGYDMSDGVIQNGGLSMI